MGMVLRPRGAKSEDENRESEAAGLSERALKRKLDWNYN